MPWGMPEVLCAVIHGQRDPCIKPDRLGAGAVSGRTWDRTRDLSRVKRALSRRAMRPERPAREPRTGPGRSLSRSFPEAFHAHRTSAVRAGCEDRTRWRRSFRTTRVSANSGISSISFVPRSTDAPTSTPSLSLREPRLLGRYMALSALSCAGIPTHLRGTQVPFELKSATSGRPDISTVRDWGCIGSRSGGHSIGSSASTKALRLAFSTPFTPHPPRCVHGSIR
jgi:hypothetical protein